MRAVRSGVIAAALALGLASVAPGCRREPPAAGQPGALAVSAALEPAEIRVGDTARLSVVVDHPAAGSLELPELDQGKAVVVIDRKRTTVALQGDRPERRERTTLDALVTSFAVGERPVGAGKVVHTDQAGRTWDMPVPAPTLRTKSVLAGEDTPLRPLKGPVRWPAPFGSWAAAAAALLLAAGFLLEARRRRIRRRIGPTSARPPVPPHVTALKELAALRGADLIRRREVEPFYRELSAIVRRYLESRFGLRAPERTTEEFIREATGSSLLGTAHQELVRAFLEQCDLVKFARHRPPPEAMTLALNAAERLVLETKKAAGP